MISWISYDWKESLTLEALNEALKPHGLKAMQFDNGDQFDFAIASLDATKKDVAIDWLTKAEYYDEHGKWAGIVREPEEQVVREVIDNLENARES